MNVREKEKNEKKKKQNAGDLLFFV